jgi:hypothetical protein
VGDDGRGAVAGADLPGIVAFPDARGARAGCGQEARRAERVSRGLEHAGRSGGPVHRSVHSGIARSCHRAAQERRPGDKVDLLILGDGYAAADRAKFEKDARRLVDILFATSPFKERRSDFNVWGLCPTAAESGISRPSTGQHRRSPVGATYDAFGSERYVLTFDNRAFRDAASFAPYDVVEILVNGQTYGGGGIYGLYATVAADSLWSPYVFVHEFGHHIAALADEYYTSDVAYLPAADRVEPWEPNVTALFDATHLKWKDLVATETPLPTPWGKQAYEAHSQAIQQTRRAIRAANKPEAEMDALFLRQQKEETAMLGGEKYAQAVGAFEGANYEAQRLLPSAGGLHHVLAEPGAVLPRVASARSRA